MANQALVTIIDKKGNEHPLPEPTSYNGTTSTMVDTGTSVSGELLGAVVRDDIAQISISWNYLKAEVWSKIISLFKESDDGSYINEVKFFDQTTNDWDTREMHISDRNAGMHRRNEQGNVLGWTGCSLQFTEV